MPVLAAGSFGAIQGASRLPLKHRNLHAEVPRIQPIVMASWPRPAYHPGLSSRPWNTDRRSERQALDPRTLLGRLWNDPAACGTDGVHCRLGIDPRSCENCRCN